MLSSTFAQDAIIAAVAALALAPTAAAHGYVSSISVNGKTYPGSNPVRFDDYGFSSPIHTDMMSQNWYYLPANQVAATAGWLALNQDNGRWSHLACFLYDTQLICSQVSSSQTATEPQTFPATNLRRVHQTPSLLQREALFN
jgi:hypothetical protein